MTSNPKNHYAVILAGGQGTRFWPVSRVKRPKQFLSISSDGRSLLQATARRIEPIIPKSNVIAVASAAHKKLLQDHLPDAKYIFEPVGRNTAASIGLAAVFLESIDPGAVMICLPADHAVKDEGILCTLLSRAMEVAQSENSLVTLGITPEFANTGYGYIKRGKKIGEGAFQVARFFEKPNLERAKSYVQEGSYYWNSGMFAWSVPAIMQAFAQYLPSMHAALKELQQFAGKPNWEEKLSECLPKLESISIDFGILEHARNCVVLEAQNLGWSDVGSWEAWAQVVEGPDFKQTEGGNLHHGDCLSLDSSNCVVYSDGGFVATLGVSDLVVIDSGNAVLVCPRERVQDVRQIVEELKKRGKLELV